MIVVLKHQALTAVLSISRFFFFFLHIFQSWKGYDLDTLVVKWQHLYFHTRGTKIYIIGKMTLKWLCAFLMSKKNKIAQSLLPMNVPAIQEVSVTSSYQEATLMWFLSPSVITVTPLWVIPPPHGLAHVPSARYQIISPVLTETVADRGTSQLIWPLWLWCKHTLLGVNV